MKKNKNLSFIQILNKMKKLKLLCWILGFVFWISALSYSLASSSHLKWDSYDAEPEQLNGTEEIMNKDSWKQRSRVYSEAKSEILAILPLNLQKESSQIFDEFERAESLVESGSDTKSIRAEKLIKLYTFLQKNAVDPNNVSEWQIWTDDFENVVEKNICENIAKQYELSTIKVCQDVNKRFWESKMIPPVETIKTDGTSVLPSWLKVILWILWIVVVGFIWVIAASAIKGKLRETHEE